MRGKDLLYDLSFIDDDIVQEAGSDEMPECFKKGNKAANGIKSTNAGSRGKQRSRRRLIAMAACLMLAVGVTAGISQTDMWSWISMEDHNGDGELGEPVLGASDTDASGNSDSAKDASDSNSENISGESCDVADSTDEGGSGVSAGGAGAVSDSRNSSSLGHAAQKKTEANSKHNAGNGSTEGSTGKENDTDADTPENTQDMIVMSPNPWASDGDEGSADSSESTAAGGAQGMPGSEGIGSSNSGENSSSESSVINSQELVDYLSGLQYTCNVGSEGIEYTVNSGNGTVYYLNLTENFARTDTGETKLTSDQIEYIKNIMKKSSE